MFLVFLVSFIISTCFAKKDIDYCEINKEHILCGSDETLENKTGIIRYAPKTNEDRESLLYKINKLRHTAAGGEFKIGSTPLPMASNMYELQWCDICEKAAKNHLKRCNIHHAFRECCNCMNTGKTDLFAASASFEVHDVHRTQKNISEIFSEFHKYHEEKVVTLGCVKNVSIDCFKGASGFHFSLLNARQVQIGCAYAECFPKEEKKYKSGILICITNLDSKLDMYGKSQYVMLEPATQCPTPQSSPSKKYPNLCKCTNITECLIKPAELSPKCTSRKGVASTTLPSTKQFTGNAPLDFDQVMDEGPIELPTPKTTKKKTTKVVTAAGGAGDASGAKNLEDGDNFPFMFMMTLFLFIY